VSTLSLEYYVLAAPGLVVEGDNTVSTLSFENYVLAATGTHSNASLRTPADRGLAALCADTDAGLTSPRLCACRPPGIFGTFTDRGSAAVGSARRCTVGPARLARCGLACVRAGLEPWACTRGIWGIANATSAAVATDKANSLITSSEGLAPRPSIPAVAELFRREFTFLFNEQTFIFWLLAREIKHPAAAAAGCPRACQFRGLCEVRNPLHRGISRSDECARRVSAGPLRNRVFGTKYDDRPSGPGSLARRLLLRDYLHDFPKVPRGIGICVRSLVIQTRTKPSTEFLNGVFPHVWNCSCHIPHGGLVGDNVFADIPAHLLSRNIFLLEHGSQQAFRDLVQWRLPSCCKNTGWLRLGWTPKHDTYRLRSPFCEGLSFPLLAPLIGRLPPLACGS